MPFDLTIAPADGAAKIYLEVAAGVTVFILAGRYFEARAKRRAGAALRALLELGAKDVAVLRDGVEAAIPSSDLAVGDRFVVRPGRRSPPTGSSIDGTSAIDASLLTGESRARRGRPRRRRHRRDRQRRRPPRRARHPGRRRHRSSPRWPGWSRTPRPARPPVQRLADRISGVFVPIVIALAVATLGFWLGAGPGRRRRSPPPSPC